MPANSFERGVRAKRRGRLLESNPFLRRRDSAGNRKRANDWAMGWHSVEVRQVDPDWTWPPLRPYPHPEPGDYDRRERGLWALFRPADLVEWDLLRAEMRLGLVSYVPRWAIVPYGILWAYADQHGACLGEQCLEAGLGHPCRYLWSAIQIQRGGAYWPPLITSAYEELIDGTLPEAL